LEDAVTSQVAILNSQGVTLASDSAVTFGDDRVYNTVNKVFPLPNPHQIAFMWSESAICQSNGMRWGRVISQFMEKKYSKRNTPAKRHSKYVDDFIKYMADQSNGFDEKQNSIAVEGALRAWLSQYPPLKLSQEIIRTVSKGSYLLWEEQDGVEDDENPESIKNRTISKLTEEVPNHLRQFHDKFSQNLPSRHPDETELATLLVNLKQFHSKALEKVSGYFRKVWNLPDDGTDWDEIIGEICVMQMACYPDPRQQYRYNRVSREDDYPTRMGDFWYDFTTMAIAGFGSEDDEPGMVELRIGPVIIPDVESNRRKLVGRTRPHKETVYQIRRPDSVDDTGFLREEQDKKSPKTTILSAGAYIKPFAMSREIDNLLNGLHNTTLGNVLAPIPHKTHSRVMDWIDERLDESGNGIGTATKKKVLEALDGTRDNDSLSDFDLLSLIHYSVMSPVMDSRISRRNDFRMVARGMPMKELADFARTLVGIEAEICQWLQSVRSVGGDIVVATITKEDGFKWDYEQRDYQQQISQL
jgi:hypothetical protein